MRPQLKIRLPQRTSHEDAISKLTRWLQRRLKQYKSVNPNADRFRFDLITLLRQEITNANQLRIAAFNEKHGQGAGLICQEWKENNERFFDAAWDLVRRGILTPALKYHDDKASFAATDFRLTEFGEKWIENLPTNQVIPNEYDRFASHLTQHSGRFGDTYTSRSLEALGCYRAQLYLACCTMCGAAAEAVALKLAIGHSGDEDKVLKDYQRSGGTTKILKQLKQGRNTRIRIELDTFFNLLKYWRDDAAHATPAELSEETAFMALLLLLRFAVFGDTRWDELTQQ